MQNVLNEILTAAEQAKSDIAPTVGGLTSFKIRTLLNALAGRVPSDEAYLELGVHIGGTLISALYGHPTVTAYACDDWSFNESTEGSPREVFARNLKAHQASLPAITVVDQNCWEMLKSPPFTKPIGAYFYDAGHAEEDQYRAIAMMYPSLAQCSMILVDDFRWPDVYHGTWRAISDLKPSNLVFHGKYPSADWDSDWHNGMGMFYIEK